MTAALPLRRLAAAALAVLLGGGALAEDSELIVFDWSGYEDPAFHPQYVEKHGDSPTFAFFADEDEAFEKLRAGFRADISHPCSQSVVKWRDSGLLKPIDPARIAAWNDILPGIRAMKDFMTGPDGRVWVIPFDWGNTLLTYNSEKLTPEDVASLRAFADPRFEGRVSIGDNVDDAYALAALAIGLRDWTQMTDAQFEEASAFLRAVHRNVRLYWTDVTDIAQAFSGGEVDLAWAWNDASVRLAAEGFPVAVNRNTAEGLSTWVCGYVLLANAPGSEDKAYDFLNAVLDEAVSNYIVTEWGYGHANAKGMAEIEAEVLEETGYGDVERFVDRTLFQSPLPNALKARMIAEFEKIKAGY